MKGFEAYPTSQPPFPSSTYAKDAALFRHPFFPPEKSEASPFACSKHYLRLQKHRRLYTSREEPSR